jgi:hypothetical protein
MNFKENINHLEKKNQVAERVKERERIEKLKEIFHKAWNSGFRKFIPCEGKKPDVKVVNRFLKQQFGKNLKELGVNLYEIAELVKKEGKEKEWKSFLEWCIIEGKNLALYGGYQEGLNSFLYYIDIDDKENQGKKKDEKLQLVLEKLELENSLLVETGSGYHIWFLSDVELANFNRKGIELRGEGLYVLFPYSRHPSGKVYEIKSGSVDNLVKLEKVQLEKVQEFIEGGGDKKQRIKEGKTEVKLRSRKIESEKEVGKGKKEVPELAEVVNLLKKRRPVLYKILTCYEGEERYQGGKYGLNRSLLEDDLANAVREIVNEKGLYLEYDLKDILYAVHFYLTGGKYKIVRGNDVKEIEAKIQERGERYLNYISEGRGWLSRLEFQKQKIRELNEREIRDWIKNGGVKILKTPVGSGKSTIALRWCEELRKKGEIPIYCSGTKKNLKEKDELKGWRIFWGRDGTNCKAFYDQDRKKELEKGKSALNYCLVKCAFRSECSKSGYLKERENFKELVKQIEKKRKKEKEGEFYFFDEIQGIGATYDFLIENQDDFHRAGKKLIIDDFDAREIQQKVSFEEIRSSYELVSANETELIGLGFQQDGIDKVKEVLLKLEQKRDLDVADFGVVDSLREIFDWIDIEKKQTPCFNIGKLIEAIKDGRAYPEPDGYGFYELKKFRYNFEPLYLGETLNEELIKKTLTKTQLKKLKITKDYGLANLKVSYHDVKVATSYWGYERKRDEFWREVYPKVKQEIEQAHKVVIFTYQKMEKELAERIRNDFKIEVWTSDDLKLVDKIPVQVVITHYWGSETRGVNLFESFDKAIFVCLPIRNITEFQKFKKALGLSETTISDDCFNELWQSIGRLRAFNKTSVEVSIIANWQNKIAKSVKKKLERFELKEDGEEKIDEKINELFNKARILQEMGGIQLYDLIDYTEIPLGKAGPEAISYLNCVGLGENFTCSDNGEIWFKKPKKGKYEFERAFLNDLKRCRGLKLYQFEGWRFNFQRRGGGKSKKKGEIVKMNIRKIRFLAYVQDVELYRKKLWERKRILIYKAYEMEKKVDTEINYEGDNLTKQKLNEMKEIVSNFNRLNHNSEIVRFQGRFHPLLSQIFDDVERQARDKNLKFDRSFLYFLDLKVAEGKRINPEQVMKEFFEIEKEAKEEEELMKKIRAEIPKELSKKKPEDYMNFVIAEIKNELREEKEGKKIDEKKKVIITINLILFSIYSDVLSKAKQFVAQNKPTISFDTS